MPNFSNKDIITAFRGINQRIDDLWCFVKECCQKIPTNIGNGVGLFKRLYNKKWEFKSIIAGTNVTIIEGDNDITISSTGGGGSFDCSDLLTCSTDNLPEGSTNLYFTTVRARASLSAGTGISYNSSTGVITNSSPSSGGTVTSFSSGNLTPLLTTSVSNPTTTPALSFSLTSTTANKWFGNNSAITTTPTYNAAGNLTATPSNVLSVSGGTNALLNSADITISQATDSSDGYLSSTDWITFDAKQGAITLTTTGSSGVATFIANTLNIPNYGSALSGYVPTSRTLTINGSSQDLSTDRTWTLTITGTTNKIDVSGGTGLTPTLTISPTYIGQTSITTLGTVTTGTLSTGAIIGGVTMTLGSDAANDIYYRDGSGILTRLANGTTGQFLAATTGSAPSWATPTASVTWNGISNPTGTQSLTFDDGELNIWTISSDTETFWTFTANSLTTGKLLSASSSTLSSGSLLDLTTTSTAAASNTQKLINLSLSGTNSSASQTTYGLYSSNTHAGSGTNVAVYGAASGGTNNYSFFSDSGTLLLNGSGTIGRFYNSAGGSVRCLAWGDGTERGALWLSSTTSAVSTAQIWDTNTNIRVVFSSNGTFIGTASGTATAKLHIGAGSASASNAPLKFTSGTNLTTAEAGAMEYNGTNLFFTRTGTTRESIITANSVNSVSPTSPNRTITVVIDGTTYYLAAKTTND